MLSAANDGCSAYCEAVASALPGRVDWSLPPPPQQEALAPEGGRRPRYRLVLPGGLLVASLPVAAWHLYGHQTVDPPGNYLYRAPDSLVELDHPIGLIAVVAVLVALGWLALEYWLRDWRVAWFAILGLLSGLGISTGIGGRVITAGVYGFNFGGAFFVFGLPVIYAATAIAIGVIAYRIAGSPAGPCPRVFTAKSGKSIAVAATVLACCAIPFAAVSIFNPSFGAITEEYGGLLVLSMAFAAVSISGLFLVCLAACSADWLLLFMPADLVRKRKRRW